MVDLLAEAEFQEQDRRSWLLATVKAQDPVDAYQRIYAAIEERMEFDDSDARSVIDDHPQRDWLMAR